MTRNVEAVQNMLGVRLVLENNANATDLGGELGTAAFLNALSGRTGCGILLDLENLRINGNNGFIDPVEELAVIDLDAVIEVHVAGARPSVPGEWHHDTHDAKVDETVHRWLAERLQGMPNCDTIILERDGRFEDAADVVDDLQRLHNLVLDLQSPTPARDSAL